MSTTRVRTRRWTRSEYERLIDRGLFREDERLELLDGLLVVKEPQGDPHAAAVDLVVAALRAAFRNGLARSRPRAAGSGPSIAARTGRFGRLRISTRLSPRGPHGSGAGCRGLANQSRVRPEAKGVYLRSRGYPGLLDRQSRRAGLRGPARPEPTRAAATRMGVRLGPDPPARP